MLGTTRRREEKGDTIIEVLFAITVFSLLAVGSLAVMNQGTAAAQRSLEITLVRQQIDGQAEALRYMQASYVAAFAGSTPYTPGSAAGQWEQQVVPSAHTGNAASYGTTCSAPSSAFIINPQTVQVDKARSTFAPAATYARVLYTPALKAGGIWVEAVKPNDFDNPANKAPYIDFHIRACWDGPGLNVPMTTGTIVRLYEPRK
jgi:type II secretory pathway pseudopilin PulG